MPHNIRPLIGTCLNRIAYLGPPVPVPARLSGCDCPSSGLVQLSLRPSLRHHHKYDIHHHPQGSRRPHSKVSRRLLSDPVSACQAVVTCSLLNLAAPRKSAPRHSRSSIPLLPAGLEVAASLWSACTPPRLIPSPKAGICPPSSSPPPILTTSVRRRQAFQNFQHICFQPAYSVPPPHSSDWVLRPAFVENLPQNQIFAPQEQRYTCPPWPPPTSVITCMHTRSPRGVSAGSPRPVKMVSLSPRQFFRHASTPNVVTARIYVP